MATEMSLEDKERINRFSRLIFVRQNTSATLARREKLLQLHSDAAEELMLLDDDIPVQYNVGDSFLFDDKQSVESYLEETQSELQTEIQSLQSRLSETNAEIAHLKKILYGKFGDVRRFTFLSFPNPPFCLQ